MDNFYKVNICGREETLPILPISPTLSIAFFNLHGAQELTEFCASELAKKLEGCEVVITAESKGLQLAHCIARNLGQKYYAVARKTKKLYMQDGITSNVNSITTDGEQTLYLSNADAALIKDKKVAIVDDVISTGGSLLGLENLVRIAGGIIEKKAFVLAEGDAQYRKDVVFLSTIPLITK
ncbi:MAG: phosphoribosyltransferase family protein [Clostridia bacterium]